MTVLGHHTVAEVKELMANKDYVLNVTRLGREAFTFPDQLQGLDWDKDWLIFLARYAAAHAAADAKIHGFLSRNIDPTVVPAEDEWQGLLRAMKIEDGVITKGDMDDLISRLAQAGVKLDFSKAPQPNSTDVDLEVFKSTDKATKVIESGTKSFLSTTAIIGGAALVVGGYIAYKTYIPQR